MLGYNSLGMDGSMAGQSSAPPKLYGFSACHFRI